MDPALLDTEQSSAERSGIESWAPDRLLRAMLDAQSAGIVSVQLAVPAIEAAVMAAASRLAVAGRLAYVGAGTSGRIAVQDGAELPPTFGWPTERLRLLMAGGDGALVAAVEGAEDDEGAGHAAATGLGAADVIVGIAASGGTPYTCACITAARAASALTIGVANVAESRLLRVAEHPILLATGAEIVAGSTRLKAGTAQKAALNLFSTLLMMRLGRTHDGLMVDMRPTNAKLRQRAVRIVQDIAGCEQGPAVQALARSGQHIKTAILVARGLEPEPARALLARHSGHLRAALAEMSA